MITQPWWNQGFTWEEDKSSSAETVVVFFFVSIGSWFLAVRKIAGQLTRICFHREHISLLRDRLWFLQSASSIGGINTQESNATVEDLMKISIAASSVINGGRKKSFGGGGGKTSLGGCGGLTGNCTSRQVLQRHRAASVYKRHKKSSCWCLYQTCHWTLIWGFHFLLWPFVYHLSIERWWTSWFIIMYFNISMNC